MVNLNNPDEQLTADKAFVTLSLFDVLEYPIRTLPVVIANLVQASVSVKRLSTFLKSDELDPNIVDWKSKPASGNMTTCGQQKHLYSPEAEVFVP